MKQIELIHDPETIDPEFVRQTMDAGKAVTIQFSGSGYTASMLADINALCQRFDESLLIRFYGHYDSGFDCKILRQIIAVKNLSLEVADSTNINLLRTLPDLKKLGLGVYNMQETEILESSNLHNLREMLIYDTKSKAFNLVHLNKFKSLKKLLIEGHSRNIASAGCLSGLETLTLRSIRKVPIGFINQLEKLKRLMIILGSRENLDDLEGGNLEELSIIWIRGLNQLGNLSRFPRLQSLEIEDEIHLPAISFGNPMPELGTLRISNCKTLSTFEGLAQLSALTKLIIYRTNLDFADFINQPMPGKLNYFGFYTGKGKADGLIKSALAKRGYNSL